MNPAKFATINQQERDWITAQIDNAVIFVDEYSPIDVEAPINLAALDRAWAAWLGGNSDDMDSVNQIINGVGISFGSLLVGSGEFEWTIATDDHGAELAIRALPDRGDVLVYPANFISKRWERKETDFLSNSFRSILEYVESMKKEWSSAGR